MPHRDTRRGCFSRSDPGTSVKRVTWLDVLLMHVLDLHTYDKPGALTGPCRVCSENVYGGSRRRTGVLTYVECMGPNGREVWHHRCCLTVVTEGGRYRSQPRCLLPDMGASGITTRKLDLWMHGMSILPLCRWAIGINDVRSSHRYPMMLILSVDVAAEAGHVLRFKRLYTQTREAIQIYDWLMKICNVTGHVWWH